VHLNRPNVRAYGSRREKPRAGWSGKLSVHVSTLPPGAQETLLLSPGGRSSPARRRGGSATSATLYSSPNRSLRSHPYAALSLSVRTKELLSNWKTAAVASWLYTRAPWV